MSPLEGAAKLTGWGLDKFQQYFGKYVAAGALKAAMTDPTLNVGSANIAQTKQFKQRATGEPLLKDIRPSAESPATSKELYLRLMLSTLGGNQFQLNEEEARPALEAMGDHPYVNAAMMFVADQIGGLPLLWINPGSKLTAAERTAVQLENLPIREMAKKLAGLQTREGIYTGAAQGAVQSAKDDQDIGLGLVGGGLLGGVIARLGAGFKGHGLAFKEAAAVKNQPAPDLPFYKEAGLVMPEKTFAQFAAEADRAANMSRVKPTVRKGEPDVSGEYKAPPVTASFRKAGELPKPTGNEKSPYSFKVADEDVEGNLIEKRILINVKEGTSKVVYEQPVTDAVIAEHETTGGLTVGENRAAYDKYIAKKYPGHVSQMYVHEGVRGTVKGKLSYMAPETAALLLPPEPGVKSPGTAQTPTPTREFRAAEPTKESRMPTGESETYVRPIVVAADSKGNLHITPVPDGALDPTLLSQPKAQKGDLVKVGDQLAVVEGERGPTVSLRMNSGQKQTVPAHAVAKVDEPAVPDMEFNFAPDYSAEPRKNANLLSMKKLTVPRVLKATGMDNPVEAAQLLREMEQAGQVVHDGNGNFFVKESHKPEFPDINEQGFLVYYDTTPDGKGRTGVIRGRDPKNGNNVIIEVGNEQAVPPMVEGGRMGPVTQGQAEKGAALGIEPSAVFAKTRKVSVPAEQIRSLKPVLWGDRKLSQLPEVMGFNTPLPSDTVVTNDLVAKQVAEYTRKAGQLSRILSPVNKVKEGLMKFINHDAWLVPTEIRGSTINARAKAGAIMGQSHVFRAQAKEYERYLESNLGGLLSSKDTEFVSVIKQNAARTGMGMTEQEAALAGFYNSHPEIDADVKETLKGALARKQEASKFLSKYFGNIEVLENLRALGIEEDYLANGYMKHYLLHEKWADTVSKQLPDVWNAAVQKIQSRHPGDFMWQSEDEMLKVMGMSLDDLKAQQKTAPGSAIKNAKARVEMAQEIEQALGKIDSSSILLAHSLAASETMVRKIKLFNEMTRSPLWSPGPRPDLGPHGGVQVPNRPEFGDAAGGRLHESMRFLVEAPPPEQEGRNMFRAISSFWKFNVVPAGGLAPWVNNVMRNWKGMVLSGGLQGPNDLGTFFDAIELMREYHANPIKATGNGQLYAEAIANNIVGAGFAGTEVNKRRSANRVLEAILKQRGKAKSMWDVIGAVPKTLVGTAEEVGAAYDTVDKLFKFTSHLNIRRNAIASGMSPDDAVAFSYVRIKQSFPDFENTAKWVEKMRKGQYAAVAPFLSSKAEDMRINATVLARLAKEPDLWARLIAASLVFRAAFELNREMRRANGITDQMADKGLAASPLRSQQFRPAAFIGPTLDEKGRMQVYDMTPWEDLLISMQAHPMDLTPSKIPAILFRNTLTGYFGDETLPGQVAGAGVSVLTGIRPLTPALNPQYRPGENGILNFMAFIAQHGGLPQAPLRMLTNQQRGEPGATPYLRNTQEQWTPEQVEMKNAGLPFAGPVGEATDIARARELKSTTGETKGQMRQVAKKEPNGPHKQYLMQQKRKAAQDAAKEFHNRGKK